jgi:hypothetical protein
MHSDLRSNLSAESVELLSRETRWQLCIDSRDPYLLLDLIIATHSTTNSGWKVEDDISAERAIFNLVQGSHENLLAFKTRFVAEQKVLVDGGSCKITSQQFTIMFI